MMKRWYSDGVGTDIQCDANENGAWMIYTRNSKIKECFFQYVKQASFLEKVNEASPNEIFALIEELQAKLGQVEQYVVFIRVTVWCIGIRNGNMSCIATNRMGQLFYPFKNKNYWYEHCLEKDNPIAILIQSEQKDNKQLESEFKKFLKQVSELEKDELSVLKSLIKEMNSGWILEHAAIRYNKMRWELKESTIYIHNYGDMDQIDQTRYYNNETYIPAKIGKYAIPVGRNETYELEIINVYEDDVEFIYRGNQYNLSKDKQIVLEKQENQATYDGPWHIAEDRIIFTLI